MATSLEDFFIKKQAELSEAFRQLPKVIGDEVVNFTLENFEAEGWQGDSFEQWPQRKNPTAWGKKADADRALLVQTAKLKRSIRVGKIEEDKVTIIAGGADIPYARVHNEGFEGEVTQNVPEHIRKTKTLKEVKVKAFTRRIHQQIPKRKFIGSADESSQLRSRIRTACLNELKKIM